MYAGDFEILLEFSKDKEVIVELGTARGLGAMVLSANGGKVYTIDHFLVVENISGTKLLKDKEKIDWVTALSTYLNHWNNIEVISKNSSAASTTFEDNSVNLLYIDADHNYPHVKYDYTTWLSKVATGGYILFHDYHEQHAGVFKFVNDLIENECKVGILEEIEYETINKTIIKIFRKV
jgi:hypothetical protein